MKAINLLEKYPEACKIIQKWFTKEFTKSMGEDDSVPEDFKEMVLQEGFTKERLAIIIDANPRSLFDVFDENEIFIFSHYMDVKSNVEFFHTIKDIDNNPITLFKTRKESENHIISGAFSALEEQITGNLNFEQLNKEEENETK